MIAALRGLRRVRVECDRCERCATARARNLREVADCTIDGVVYVRCTAWPKEWTA